MLIRPIPSNDTTQNIATYTAKTALFASLLPKGCCRYTVHKTGKRKTLKINGSGTGDTCKCNSHSTRRVSTAPSSFLTIVPPAWTKAIPSPSSLCKMKPSPPKRPAPIFFVKATSMLIPFAAHRKASFWHR